MSDLNIDLLMQAALPKMVRNEVHPATIAIVGEAPGSDEVDQGHPFVGASGRLLWGILSSLGVHRHQCAVLNVSQHRLAKRIGDEDAINWECGEIQAGLIQLALDLATVKPNIVICLGSIALRAASGMPRSVHSWRGSLFRSSVWGCKCISTIHPAAVLRNYEWIQLLRFDLGKAIRHSKTADLVLPAPNIRIAPALGEVIDCLAAMRDAYLPVTLDIEGRLGNIRCIGFSNSAMGALVIPFVAEGGGHFWSESDEALVICAIAELLTDVNVPKILQNYLYDGFVIPLDWHIPIRGLADDTMVKHWELLPELEKALAVQASIYTDVPYYKDERESPDGTQLWTYCGRDCTTTHEINDVLTKQLNGKSCERHYRFNMSLLAPLNYMQLRGVRIDVGKRKHLLTTTQQEIYELQHAVNSAAHPYGCYYPLPEDTQKLLAYVADVCCYKRGVYRNFADLLTAPKAPWQATIGRIVDLCTLLRPRTPCETAELDTLIGRHINVDSNKQLVELLYQKMALPTQYKKIRGRKTDKPTTDVLALLTLFGKTKNADLTNLLKLRCLLGRLEGLHAIDGPHNRLYSGYNLVGTETGRVQTYKPNFGVGKSIQTETSRHKSCYIPDNDKWLAELDLSAADMWTVAAECAHVGDTTLLDDLKCGISPHKVLVLAYTDQSAIKLDRKALLAATKTVSKKGWLYYACKRVGHMSNYGGGADTMSDQITKDAWNKEQELVYVEPVVCARLQALYFARYGGVKSRMRWLEQQLRTTGSYTSAGGHTRIFFGRRDDHKTVGEFYADGPQENTTYVTNLSLYRLWYEQIAKHGKLIVEPLFHRHDALGVQFPKDHTAECCQWLREWFTNSITVSGIPVTIPAEGGYGPSWGELDNEI